MIIAVDFDGTLCSKAPYPGIGEPNMELIEWLQDRKKKGDQLILWTCRDGEALYDAVSWCANLDLNFTSVNKNVPENIALHDGNDTRKIYADIYIDDRSVRPDRLDEAFGDAEVKKKVFYVCDRRACVNCSAYCNHTSDIKHAASFTLVDNKAFFEIDEV